MFGLRLGKYSARLAQTEQDVMDCQKLRARVFRGALEERDTDAFDTRCNHVMIECAKTSDLAACFRLLELNDGSEIAQSYSAQFYDLSALEAFCGKMAEMGRFCISPGLQDPDVLRVAWAAMTRYVDDNNIEMLFGCSSFSGTDSEGYEDAFALLKDRHLAPSRWLPQVKAASVFPFSSRLRLRKPDLKQAMKTLPPLLRTYLLMGGWVSDHAVVDRDLNTLHVFTGLEIEAIPPARARLLRATAG